MLTKLLAPLAAALSRVGSHGTLILAGSIFVGLDLPGLTSVFKPYLGPAIVFMLILAFLRVDPAEMRRHWTRPGLIAAAVVWCMLVVPAVMCTLALALGVGHHMPGLFFMLVLQLSAPGLISSPAVSALLGLKLFAIIAGSALTAMIVRRLAGSAFIEAQRERIDGLSVLAMALFAIAAMDGVAGHIRSSPLLVLGLLVLGFVLALGQIAVTAFVFRPAGRARAFAIGLIAASRNMGLMLTATGFGVPEVARLYFALAQFPIYLLPHLLKPLAQRVQIEPAD
ncbi:MAG: hypothetical protein P8014_20345 [Acidihalobacter sp.]|uniref:hypothetical protein n=1 Tax=Acidihalobacter sp. TaxID=1872108 RepID=UPI00307DDAC2